MTPRITPPWLPRNQALASKLARNHRLKAKGLAALPASKVDQREIASAVGPLARRIPSRKR